MARLEDIFYNKSSPTAYHEISAGGHKILQSDKEKMSKLKMLRQRMNKPNQDRYPVYKKYIAEKSWSAQMVPCSQNYPSQGCFSQLIPNQQYLPPNLYDVLGLTPSASQAEIRGAYRSLARSLHPDKGGNQEEFAKVQEAYEILSDVFLSEIYNEKGYDEVMLYKNNTF